MVTATQLTSGTTTSTSGFDTSSIAPSANKLVILTVASNKTAGPGNVPDVYLNGGAVWTQIATTTLGDLRVTMFRYLSSSPASGVVTINFAAQTQQDVLWTVAEFGNVDTGGTNGANAVVQNAAGSSNSTDSTFAITLSAFSGGNNATHGVIYNNDTSAISAGTNFTELALAAGAHRLESEWANSNQTSVKWTFAGLLRLVGLAIEIKGGQSFQGAMI